ncbi:MAG: ABC transporter permease [Ruminococcus flavefaciens]|nr:ABC transporter permease [Ruminococcus flavefaciens]
MVLNKRIKRSFRNKFSFYLCSILLTMLTSAFLIACISTGNTLKNSVNEFFDNNVVEDAEFNTYSEISSDEIAQLEKDYDVIMELNRYKDAVYGDSTIRTFVQTEKVNKYEVVEGSDISSDSDILITKRYADENGIEIGDELKFYGESFTVCGFAVKADYLYMTENLSDAYRNNTTFALAVVTENAFDKIDASENNFYAIVYNDDNELDVRKKINDSYTFMRYLSAEANTRIAFTKSEGDSVNFMAQGGCPVLFVIVVAIIAIVLSRMIKNESVLLGTFLALGYKKSYLVRYYIKYGLISGVAGSILGFCLKSALTKALVSFYIDNDFEAFPYELKYSSGAVIAALVVPSLLYVLAVIAVVLPMLRKPAIQLLNNIQKNSSTVKIFVGSKVKVFRKMQFRSILGHITRSLVVLLGISISSMCLMAGFNSYSSIRYVLEHGVEDTVAYKYQYMLNYIGEGEPEEGEGVLSYVYEVENSVTQLTLTGIDSDTEFYPLETQDGDKVDTNKYYLTAAASKTFGVKKDQKIKFMNSTTLEEYEVEVSGIISDDMHAYLYTGRKNAADIIGLSEDSYNIIVSDEELDLPEENVTMSVNKGSAKDTLRELIQPMMTIIYVFVAIGLLLALFILYLIVNMIVEESVSTISLSKVLGLTKREISRMILNTNHILVVIGFIIGIPSAYLFSSMQYKDAIAQYGMSFNVHVSPLLIVIAFLIVWAAYYIVLAMLRHKAFRTDMVEALKDTRKE